MRIAREKPFDKFLIWSQPFWGHGWINDTPALSRRQGCELR
jgi:hypothetical protein